MRPASTLWRCASLFLVLFAASVRADTYDDMRANWFNNLTGGTSYDATDPDVVTATASLTNNANAYWTILKATRPFSTTPFSDIAIGSNSDNITVVYNRLETMAKAYWAIGGSLYQNATLKADIISTLDWLNTNIYNSTTTSYGNWYAWQIGIPLSLNNITVLLYDSLTAAQIANYMGAINHFMSSPTQINGGNGANGAWSCSIVGLRGVIVKDAAKIAAASAQYSVLTAYVTSPDGFFTDGSNIGHGSFSYTAGYGLALLQQLADGYYLFNPTALSSLPASKRSIIYGWVLNSYQTLMYQGKIPYYSYGRDISRGPSDGRGTSISAVASEIAAGDPSAAAGQVLAFAKNVFAASGGNYSGLGGIGAVIRMKSLLGNIAVPTAADPVGTHIFPIMDRATSIQNGFAAHLAWYSTRTHNYESINGENLKGWHLSDGLLYLENADWNQFNGNFWATVNSQRLPGTTVTAGMTPAQDLANGSTFAGGAALNNLFGAVGFVLQPANGQTLTANKSWFFFDDQIVCLGSGITGTDGKTVETVVENRKLNAGGSNPFTVNGTVQSTSLGWSATQSGVKWMHLAGSVNGADIGYYFPTAATLTLLREARTSSWSTLDSSKSTASVTDNYLTAILSHGTSPTASSYAYILLPGLSAAQTAAYAAAPTVSVLQNNASASSVYDAKPAASGTVFWQDQSAQAAIDKIPTYLTADKKAVVMTQTSGNQFTVAVSDPTQANTAGINLTVSSAFAALVSADAGVSVTQLSPTLKFSVATAGAKGRTFQAVFSTAAPASGAIPVASVSASADDGNVPSNVLDNNFSTRWSAQGDGQWIQFDFANAWQVGSASAAFYFGTARTTSFDLLASLDGTTWTTVGSYVSSGQTNGLQSFALPTGTWARHLRLVGHGNSQGTGWNSITEVQFFGSTTVATFGDYKGSNFVPAQLADPSVSGQGACPAGDGVTNLMKYSQGLPPLTNASGTGAGLPGVQVQNGYLTLTYTRMKNATDLAYTPEVSGDLSTWQSGSAYTTPMSAIDVDPATQRVVVRSNTPISNGGRQAIRLRVDWTAAGAAGSASATALGPEQIADSLR